ncbi:MAG TPA: NAD-dependent epimerase/dehydratase family protein, partial [Stellaceae bacterium]|nr:NAD-dependent epimerase/dehydratase family protein [Stellaceae bacterium]
FRDRVRLTVGDVRDTGSLAPLIEGRAYLFNLAGRTSHMGSLEKPVDDLEVNALAQLRLLELCRTVNPGLVIVHAGTRQIYGRPDALPVDESHPVRPPDPNAVAKHAGEAYHLLYHRLYGLATVSLRLTNTYGPGLRIKDDRQAFLGVWVRRVLQGEPIEVWGGEQRRDLAYVEDVADAFLLAAIAPEARGRAFNIGAGPSLSLGELAQLMIAANGGGSVRVLPFPSDRRRIDIGDYEADDRAFRAVTGWAPRTMLADGLKRTFDYYRSRRGDYL